MKVPLLGAYGSKRYRGVERAVPGTVPGNRRVHVKMESQMPKGGVAAVWYHTGGPVVNEARAKYEAIGAYRLPMVRRRAESEGFCLSGPVFEPGAWDLGTAIFT